MASILFSDVRKGMVIIRDGQLCYVVDRELRTPGNLPSKLTLKLKYLKSGNVNNERVHPEDKVEQAYLDKRPMQYLYQDGDDYVFMDLDSYDQIHVPGVTVGDAAKYLLPEAEATVAIHESVPLYIELATSVFLEVTYTEPGLQGDRSTGGTKPATLETGATIQVPLFITTGEKIKVDTRDGRYLGRA